MILSTMVEYYLTGQYVSYGNAKWDYYKVSKMFPSSETVLAIFFVETFNFYCKSEIFYTSYAAAIAILIIYIRYFLR